MTLRSSPVVGEVVASWRTLLGATMGSAVGVHSLPFYTAGLFMVALEADEGWSRSAISLGVTFFALGLGLAAPIVGALCDRVGERAVIIPGLLVHVAALFALSRMETLTAFYILMGGMALFGAGSGSLAYVRLVNRRFDAGKGTALGLLITGSAGLSALAPLLVAAIIGGYGWRAGYLALGAIVAGIGPIALLLLRFGRGAPSVLQERTLAPFTYARLLRDRTFRMLSVASVLVAVAVPGLVTHLAPMLKDEGAGTQTAGRMLALVGITQTVARLGTGILADRLFAPKLATAIFLMAAAGLAIFALAGASLAVIGAIATGLAYGAETDLLGYLVGRYFPAEQFGKILGLLLAIFLGGSAISPLWYGWAAEYSGSYRLALMVSAAALVVSATIFWRMPAFIDARRPCAPDECGR